VASVMVVSLPPAYQAATGAVNLGADHSFGLGSIIGRSQSTIWFIALG
jgi:hypothetical protein